MVLEALFENFVQCFAQTDGYGRCLALLLAVVLAGPIMLCTGMGLTFRGTTNHRMNNIKAYNHQVGMWRAELPDLKPQLEYMNMTVQFYYTCKSPTNMNKKSTLYNLTMGVDPEDEILDPNTEDVEPLSPQLKYFFERQQDEAMKIDSCDIKVTVRSNETSLVQVRHTPPTFAVTS